MYVVIVGAGEVGSHLARILVAEGHDVAVIEQAEEVAERLDASLDALVVRGSGIAPEDLRRGGLENADLLLAVTATDEVNLIACMTARKYGRRDLRAIARVRQVRGGGLALEAADLGLEALVSPDRAIAKAIGDALRYPGPGEMRELAGGRLALVGMVLGSDSPLVRAPLASLRRDYAQEFLVVAVRGDRGTRVPSGSDRLEIDERAFVVARPESLAELAILSGQPWHRVRRVLMIGCDHTGLAVSPLLVEKGLSLTIIEQEREQAERAAELIPGALVRRADGTDPDLLRSAIEEDGVDTVIVLLPEAETSVLIGIFAKSLGAAKVIVRCDEAGYATLATNLGVDLVLSPKRAMADAVLEKTRWSAVVSALLLGDHEVEILQLEVPAEPNRADLVTKPLKSLGFPPGCLVGAVIRGEEVLVGSGDTVLRPGDEILVITRPDALAKVEELIS